jgi:hypothetical protein
MVNTPSLEIERPSRLGWAFLLSVLIVHGGENRYASDIWFGMCGLRLLWVDKDRTPAHVIR